MKLPKAAPVLPLTHEYITCLQCGFNYLWRICGQIGDCINCNCGSFTLREGEIKINFRSTNIMVANHTGQRVGLVKYLQDEMAGATTMHPQDLHQLCERLAPRFQKQPFEVRRAAQFVMHKNKTAARPKPTTHQATQRATKST